MELPTIIVFPDLVPYTEGDPKLFALAKILTINKK